MHCISLHLHSITCPLHLSVNSGELSGSADLSGTASVRFLLRVSWKKVKMITASLLVDEVVHSHQYTCKLLEAKDGH